MDNRSEGSLIEVDHASPQGQNIIHNPLLRMSHSCFCRAITTNWCDIGRVTIDILPGDVLLEIFDYYVTEAYEDLAFEEWQILVQVCQKWRYVVFQSPLRLNLRILCSAQTPVREKLAAWPLLPIIIDQEGGPPITKCGENNIIAALGHNNRICKIDLAIPGPQLETVFAAMQKTFGELKELALRELNPSGDTAPVVPDSFLGGSSPHLQGLWLVHISFPFPVLRNILLSTTNLVTLSLYNIPHSAYISPEEMVTCLPALTRLNLLDVKFESPRSRPPQAGRHRPPTRSVLPALAMLTFTGASEYLNDLLARIDTPLLDAFNLTFFHQLIFDTPQLGQFISRTPKLKVFDEARVIFSYSGAKITLEGRDSQWLVLEISCGQSDWQLSSMAQIFTSSFPQAFIPMLEHLYILDNDHGPEPLWQDELEDDQWLELFHPFAAVKNLYVSREFVPRIAPAFQGLVGERVLEVFPSLQNIFLEDLPGQESGFVPEAMRHFIAARQLSTDSCIMTISHWTRQHRCNLSRG